MAKLIFLDTGEEVDLPDNASIATPCEEAGVPFACTEGVCGTCLIEVEEGMENLTPLSEAEQDFGICGKERLACQCKIRSGRVRVRF